MSRLFILLLTLIMSNVFILRDSLQVGLGRLSAAGQPLLDVQGGQSQSSVASHLYCETFLQNVVDSLEREQHRE